MKTVFYTIFTIVTVKLCSTESLSATDEKLEIIINSDKNNPTTASSSEKTIESLVQEQTDIIKRIVANHKPAPTEYPITKESVTSNIDKVKLKVDKETESIAALRRRCQQTATLGEKESLVHPEPSLATVEAFGPTQKPGFLKKQPPQSFPGLPDATTETQRYFLLTRPPGSNSVYRNQYYPQQTESAIEQNSNVPKTLQTVASAVEYPTNIKYIQLEPVILQKTFLNNGRTLFYWYRSLPTISQYGQTLSAPQNEPSPLSSQVPIYLTTSPTTTTTTTTSTTPEPPVAVSSEENLDKPAGETEDDAVYSKQFKFVVTMPYPPSEDVPKTYPWQFDPFAYFPKSLQPRTVNVPIPYSPTYHMIRTLNISPNTDLSAENASSNDKVETY